MSGGPNRQRSLKDRLKDGIAQSWPKRRGSQGSNPSKGGRSYVIPTTAAATTANKFKPSAGDNHGYLNQIDREFKSHSVDEKSMATSTTTPGMLVKTASEPGGEHSQHQVAPEKARRPPAKSVAQPEGTFTYTVDKNDTLTSIAARFETTPSELAKINRLVSRLICPGKVIFVPKKSTNNGDDAGRQSPSANQMPGNLKPESPPSDIVQGSPKPGRVERVCSSPSPPHSSAVKILSKEEEQKLDQDCIERFLKINGVRHITDGQGVVSGVLLVTPNAAMFEPSVMETLVSERGIDHYYVSAPLQNVVNAALYTDIAHMKVRHAPIQTSNLPPPEIYFPKDCQPYKSQSSDADGELLAGLPKRSESQQAVKGSVSDKADLELSEEDSDENSIGSCRSDSKASDAPSVGDKSVNSEVFADDRPGTESTETAPEPGGNADAGTENGSAGPENKHEARMRGNWDRKGTDGSGTSVRFSDLEYDDVEESARATRIPTQSSSLPNNGGAAAAENEFGVNTCVGSLPNGQVSYGDGAAKDAQEVKRRNPGGLALLTSFTDSLWPMSQSGPTTKEEAERLQIAPNRKHSIPDGQQASEKSRLKVLKRLSYPLWGGDAVEAGAAEATESAAGILERNVQPQNQGQTALSRILNSPRNLVDFSSGLFLRNNDVSKVEDISQFQRQISYSLPTPLPEVGKHGFQSSKAGERRGSSPEGLITFETENPHVGMGRRFSDGTSAEAKNSRPSSKEDIRIEFKSEVTLEDKKDLFQNIDEIVPVPARSCDDPPLYLCLRMGRPIQKTKAATGTSPTSASTNGRQERRRSKKPLKCEYWFSIPKDRVDELYHFIEQWAPGAYGSSINEADLRERGLELITSDELSDEELESIANKAADMAVHTPKKASADLIGMLGEAHPDWENFKIFRAEILLAKLRRENRSSDSEVVSMNDVRENRFSDMSLDLELPLPELIGESEILTEEHRREIFKVLPARAEGYSWSLIFSAAEHGFSLQSMYRRMARYESPVLLIIQDTENNVFGAMTSCVLKASDHFYGTGESFLYTFYPEFKTFKWTGDNVFFIKGNPESLAIGAGDGLFGLWLDGDLYHGRSHCCKTYNNDTLSSNEDFCVKMLEAWGFVDFGSSDAISLC